MFPCFPISSPSIPTLSYLLSVSPIFPNAFLPSLYLPHLPQLFLTFSISSSSSPTLSYHPSTLPQPPHPFPTISNLFFISPAPPPQHLSSPSSSPSSPLLHLQSFSSQSSQFEVLPAFLSISPSLPKPLYLLKSLVVCLSRAVPSILISSQEHAALSSSHPTPASHYMF